MGKKKNKEIVLDEQGILSECATSLVTAFDYAIEHRDVDAMLAVSDRWVRLYAILSEVGEAREQIKLGFIKDDNSQ